MRGLGLLILRLAVGGVFVAHGLPKIIPLWGLSPTQTAALLDTAGVSPSYTVAVGTGVTEVLAGLLLMAGAYTVWVSLLLAATTAATSWILHVPHGFFLNWSLAPEQGHGYEFDLLQVSALTCLMLVGPGILSYDARRTREKDHRRSQTSVRSQKG